MSGVILLMNDKIEMQTRDVFYVSNLRAKIL